MRRETSYVKAETVRKGWRLVDAEGESLGRLAAEVAVVLMGKHRPDYTPFVDCGDFVVVVNAKKVGMTGRKAEQKMHKWYTGYPDGLKTVSYGELRERKPELLIQQAVKRMLPKNRLGRVMLKNLKVYPGADHPYASHKPVKMEI